MGLFDFFKSKKGDDSKSALISKHTNFSYAYINNCFKRFYKEIENFENDEDLFYWYKINYDMSQFAKDAEQIISINKKNKHEEKELNEHLWTHYEEYHNKMQSESLENKMKFIGMRIISFGALLNFYNKLMNEIHLPLMGEISDQNYDLTYSVIYKSEYEILHCRARLYGSIKFALSNNISKEKIKHWYPDFMDNNELYKGQNPIDNLLNNEQIIYRINRSEIEIVENSDYENPTKAIKTTMIKTTLVDGKFSKREIVGYGFIHKEEKWTNEDEDEFELNNLIIGEKAAQQLAEFSEEELEDAESYYERQIELMDIEIKQFNYKLKGAPKNKENSENRYYFLVIETLYLENGEEAKLLSIKYFINENLDQKDKIDHLIPINKPNEFFNDQLLYKSERIDFKNLPAEIVNRDFEKLIFDQEMDAFYGMRSKSQEYRQGWFDKEKEIKNNTTSNTKTNQKENIEVEKERLVYVIYGEHATYGNEETGESTSGDRYLIDHEKRVYDENEILQNEETLAGFVNEVFISEDKKVIWEEDYGENRTEFTNSRWEVGEFESEEEAIKYLKEFEIPRHTNN